MMLHKAAGTGAAWEFFVRENNGEVCESALAFFLKPPRLELDGGYRRCRDGVRAGRGGGGFDAGGGVGSHCLYFPKSTEEEMNTAAKYTSGTLC